MLPNLPEVMSAVEGKHIASYSLFVPKELVYFQGHFDGFAILPGVVQIDWACQFARNLLGNFHSQKIKNLKFSAPIYPSASCTLTLHADKPQQCRFLFEDEVQVLSEGVICYEC